MNQSQTTPGFASRVSALVEEGAYATLAQAQRLEAAGREIIHLEIGQPDVPTFDNVVEAGIDAIRAGHTRYNPPAGTAVFREALAAHAGCLRGIEVKPAQVIVSPGTKPMLFFPTLAVVEPGDEVIYPDPGFPTYEAMIQVADGVPVPVPLREETGFAFDLAELDARLSDRTRMIILNSPSNPTGGVLHQGDLQQIADRAIEHDIWVLSDEIYARITYDGNTAPSIARLPGMRERTIIVDGFSKTYAMTGWRLGFAVMPEPFAERVSLLLTHSTGCTATFTQYAGLEAITGPQVQAEAAVAEYKRRRDVLVAGFNEIPGVRCLSPEGAFYAFPNVSAFGLDSQAVADYLLEEAGVAVLAGTAFGAAGEGYLRVCFANSMENIRRALDRMGDALRALPVGERAP